MSDHLDSILDQLIFKSTPPPFTILEPVRIQVTSQVNSLKGAPAIALDCHASGDPTPTVSWSKLEGTINRNDPRYIILPNGDFILTTITSGTMEKDSGVYKCTATNGVTTTSKLSVGEYRKFPTRRPRRKEERKEGNVLFNDALNSFYLRLYEGRKSFI